MEWYRHLDVDKIFYGVLQTCWGGAKDPPSTYLATALNWLERTIQIIYMCRYMEFWVKIQFHLLSSHVIYSTCQNKSDIKNQAQFV